MNLTEAKKQFHALRKLNRIDVCTDHVIDDHPERGYTFDEVVSLVKMGQGTFEDTTDAQYRGVRFYWRTKDIDENSVRLVIEFEEDDQGKLILVVSAGGRQ